MSFHMLVCFLYTLLSCWFNIFLKSIFNWLFAFLLLNFKSSLFILHLSFFFFLDIFWKDFLPVCGLTFHSFNFFCRAECFKLNEVQLIFFFCRSCFWHFCFWMFTIFDYLFQTFIKYFRWYCCFFLSLYVLFWNFTVFQYFSWVEGQQKIFPFCYL